MSQSLANLMVHLVFSTKNREQLICADMELRLYSYLSAIAKNINISIIEKGGMPDHVHLLINLSRTITLGQTVQQLKAGSSRFMKEISPTRDFSWQRGYGAFSVSPSQKSHVINYIKNQKKHHLYNSFQDEYRKLLIKHEIIFDEKYIWD